MKKRSVSFKSIINWTLPALRALLALILVLFIGELVFRRWLGPVLGIHIQNMADFTVWPEMLYLGLLFPLTMVLAALGLYLVVDRRKLKDFGFSSDMLSRTVTWMGLVLMLAGFGILIVLTQVSGTSDWSISPEVTWRFVLSAAVAYIGTGVWEEFYFRGYFFRTLLDYGRPAAYLASIAVFVLLHFTEETFVVSRVFNLVLVSLFLTYVFDKTGSVWPGIILHGSWNLIFFLVAANQYSVSFLMVTGDISQAMRWLSNILHAILLLVVWLVYRQPDAERE